MMMAMMGGLGAGCAVRAGRLHIGLQLGEGALRAAEIPRGEGFAKSGEIALNWVVAGTRWLLI